MRKITIIVIGVLILLGVGLLIFNYNKSTTVGEIFEEIENDYGNILSIRIEDNTTEEIIQLTDEESINQFRNEISSIEVEPYSGRDSSGLYSLNILTEGPDDAAGQRIIGIITSGEMSLNNEFYTGDGINELLDKVEEFISNN